MNWYGVVKLLHLSAVAIFIGSIITVWVGKWFADRCIERERLLGVLDMLLYIDQRVTGPSAGVLTISGLLLLVWSPSALYELWLQALILIWILSAVIAHAMLVPRLRALRTLVAVSGPHDYENKSLQWSVLSALLIGAQFVALCLSVLKPGL